MNKKALITGSSDGIGAQIAFTLSKKGYEVFLTGRNEEKLKLQAEKCGASGYFATDLLDENASKTLFGKAQNALGQIDILINNAGEYIWSPIEKTDFEKITRLLNLNLKIPYELCSLATGEMKQRGWGRIINIGSISGIVGEANASLYSTSKAGLIGLTKSLALELAEFGITVNLVNPGWVKTDLTIDAMVNEQINEEEELDMIPQRRFIEPQEVAQLVAYIASEEAKGMTGQCVNLCAGLSLG